MTPTALIYIFTHYFAVIEITIFTYLSTSILFAVPH